MFILASSNFKPRPTNLTAPNSTKLSHIQATSLPPSPYSSDATELNNKEIQQQTNTLTNAKLISMVIPVLLMRCREVLQRFVVDDRQSGQCPLPRYRLAEVFLLVSVGGCAGVRGGARGRMGRGGTEMGEVGMGGKRGGEGRGGRRKKISERI